jgi:hypothetical protein
MSAQVEQWRVSTIEGIFETDLETLKQWIGEGCVLPTDKVSKGKLSWIEAGRAPMLRAAFNGETATLPPAISATEVELPQLPPVPNDDSFHIAHSSEPGVSTSYHIAPAQLGTACHNHPDVSPKFVCRVCASPFCAECPRYVGTTSIPICSLCGDMCKPYEEVRRVIQRHEFQSSGFGFQDFGRALRYPLEHKIALVFGAAVYGFLQLAGIRGAVVAFVIMFGCISHVISQVAWGRLNRSFLPDFSAFSLWDDLAVPIGLGIGITIVTWGPALTLLLALVFGVINGPTLSPVSDPAAMQQPSTALTPDDLDALTNPEADPQKTAAANEKLNSTRPGSIISKEAERSQKELNDPAADLKLLLKYLRLPVLLVLLLFLSILWGIFYGPMALCVAGYTEQFSAVINPLVGLDTIRRMGATYFKAFGMVILVQIVGLVVSVIVAIVTAPFAMPFFGNLPANFINGAFTFYFYLVIACILGLSLHKCADRLGIEAK